jgi:hypothetical protein
MRPISTIADTAVKNALAELQGFTISVVAGAAAGTKMNIAAIREEDTILSALVLNPVVALAVAEVSNIDVDATGGTFTITWNGQTTAVIAYNAVAATVQAALEALSNINVGDVVVTGGVGQDGGGAPYILTWNAKLGNVAQPTTGAGSLTGGGGTATVTTATGGVAQSGGQPLDDSANVTISSVKASGTLTISGNPTNNDTFVVNGYTYTFKTTPTHVQHVAISAGNNATMAASVASAVNTVENMRTGVGNANAPAVVATVASNVVTFTATHEGAGNVPVIADVGTTITLDDAVPTAVEATFLSAAEDDALVVNGVSFVLKDEPSTDLEDAEVDVAATDSEQATLMAAAINAYENIYGTLDIVATADAAVVTLTPRSAAKGNAVTLTENATNVAVSGSGYLANGTDTGSIVSTQDHAGESLVVYWFNKR